MPLDIADNAVDAEHQGCGLVVEFDITAGAGFAAKIESFCEAPHRRKVRYGAQEWPNKFLRRQKFDGETIRFGLLNKMVRRFGRRLSP